MPHDVFISYSSKDKPTADAVCAKLESAGVRCWIAPRDILPGRDWSEAIVDALDGCQILVLVFSSHANESQQIKREVERAVNKGLPIVPFRIEDVMPAKSLEYFISTPHWLDAITPPLERHLAYLVDTVKVLIERSPEETIVRESIALPPKQHGAAARGAEMLRHFRALSAKTQAIIAGGVLVALWILSQLFSSGPVDSVLRGKWTTMQAGLRIDYDIHRNGEYTTRVSVDEHGRARFERNILYLDPAGGAERPANWEQHRDGTVTSVLIPTVLWTFIGTVAGGGGHPEVVSEISAVATNPVWTKAAAPKAGVTRWQFEPSIGGVLWHMNFDVADSGEYAFHAHADDSGSFQAHDGKWTFITNTQLVLTGTYQPIDRNTVAMMVPFGQSVWKRAS